MNINPDNLTNIALTSAIDSVTDLATARSLFLEIAEVPINPDRHNRLCVTISDLHLTDGTVGLQNLGNSAWDGFFKNIVDTCFQNEINEVVVILDGDVIDLIRSGCWAEANHYPWQREDKAKFDEIVLKITKKIVEIHEHFFRYLKDFDGYLKRQCQFVKTTDIVILLGNHDKELMLCNEALSYFYEHALGRISKNFSDIERAYIGRMYGDKELFLRDKNRVPFFPFYHADKGFRFFTTHGQWRDDENSRATEAKQGKPGWSSKDGWQPEIWEKLNYSPFLDACFGDTVAAGVLSTFIYKTKRQLNQSDLNDDPSSLGRLNRILDELDLYRPSYLAVKRIVQETRKLREKTHNSSAAGIVENNLTQCIHEWLNWDFTLQSATKKTRIILKVARFFLIWIKKLGQHIELSAMLRLMEGLAFFSHYKKTTISLDEMKKFPGFSQAYARNGFQIHGEGHTHQPLQEEANISIEKTEVSKANNTNFTYVNFGTWRDQIVNRQASGYRRRGVFRTFKILDLRAVGGQENISPRRFNYYTEDCVIWGDEKDRIEESRFSTAKVDVVQVTLD